MEMKSKVWIVLFLALVLIAAEPVKLYQLTIINKSGMDLGIQLLGTEDDEHYYYLIVPEGDKDFPTEKTYTIVPDLYNMRVFYIETYDPVYGFKCRQPQPNQLLLTRNIKVVFLPCNEFPRNVGEASMRKYLPFSLFRGAFLDYWFTRFLY
jgi:hypothetical protein